MDNINQRIANLSPEKRKLLQLKLNKNVFDGHTILAKSLKEHGITHVYSISGTPIEQTLSLCAKNNIRVIGVHHQQAAVMMAAAQNYLTGKLVAAVILSAGPAVTNSTTGILVAQDNCFPLLVIGSRRALEKEGIGYFQELNAVPIFASITKSSKLVDSTAKIYQMISEGIKIAISGRPGVSYLDIPEDILDRKIDTYNNILSELIQVPQPNQEVLEKAIDLLKKAQRPVLIIGKGIRWSEPYQEIDFLVNNLGIPFITSPMGKGYLPDNNSLCFNAISSQILLSSDLILIVAARLNWTFRFGTEFAENAQVIHIDIEPSELGKNIIPTVGIVGDAKAVLKKIVSGLTQSKLPISNSWLNILYSEREKKINQWELLAQEDSLPISPHRLIKEIGESLPQDAIVVIDGRVILQVSQNILPSYFPASRFTSGTNGCMGTGIPFGIGAKLSYPHRPVIVITGDTAFGFNAMEMETAIRLRLPIIVIIANNQGNSGSLKQKAFYSANYPDLVTMFQPNIRYEKIMEAFGGCTEYVETSEQIKPAFTRALKSGISTCINVKVNPETPDPNR